MYHTNYTYIKKWRSDRRSERSLCNCVKKPEKNSGLQRGLNPWPCETGAMLYQLSYEATDVSFTYKLAKRLEKMQLVVGPKWFSLWDCRRFMPLLPFARLHGFQDPYICKDFVFEAHVSYRCVEGFWNKIVSVSIFVQLWTLLTWNCFSVRVITVLFLINPLLYIFQNNTFFLFY